jgi:outer membrane protein
MLSLLVCGFCLPLEAQQITRFAVVDLTKVYTAFFQDSQAVRDLENESAQVQAEINRMNRNIQSLKNARADADRAGDQQKSLQLGEQISNQTTTLREYYQAKTTDLEQRKKNLAQSGSFLQQVYEQIRFIAESEGYSMVLNLKDNNGIIWYSPTVDITDKVIQNLKGKSVH